VHLDDADLDDDLAYLDLPTDEEAAESAAEQRALMASFETQRRDEAARCLMAAERRAAADELRAVSAGRRTREDRARVEIELRLQYERARAAELARVRGHQYPIAEDAQRLRWQQLWEARLRRRLETHNHGRSGGSDAGGSGA
jgi:hypothetical protein